MRNLRALSGTTRKLIIATLVVLAQCILFQSAASAAPKVLFISVKRHGGIATIFASIQFDPAVRSQRPNSRERQSIRINFDGTNTGVVGTINCRFQSPPTTFVSLNRVTSDRTKDVAYILWVDHDGSPGLGDPVTTSGATVVFDVLSATRITDAVVHFVAIGEGVPSDCLARDLKP